MVKGANNHGQGKVTPSALKPSATVSSYKLRAPRTTGYSSMARRQEYKAQEASYERTSRIKNEDNKSGCYERYTTKEKVSSRDFYKDRGSGHVGVKDEYKRSSTAKIGDKSGYTEYYNEEKIRNVSFDNQSYNYGSNKQIPAYGKDYDSDCSNELQSNGCDSDGSNNDDVQANSDDDADVQAYSDDDDDDDVQEYSDSDDSD